MSAETRENIMRILAEIYAKQEGLTVTAVWLNEQKK